MGIDAITYFIIFGIVIIICCAGWFLYCKCRKKKNNISNSTQEPILIPQDIQPLETI